MLAIVARSRKCAGKMGVNNSTPMLRLNITEVKNLTLFSKRYKKKEIQEPKLLNALKNMFLLEVFRDYFIHEAKAMSYSLIKLDKRKWEHDDSIV